MSVSLRNSCAGLFLAWQACALHNPAHDENGNMVGKNDQSNAFPAQFHKLLAGCRTGNFSAQGTDECEGIQQMHCDKVGACVGTMQGKPFKINCNYKQECLTDTWGGAFVRKRLAQTNHAGTIHWDNGCSWICEDTTPKLAQETEASSLAYRISLRNAVAYLVGEDFKEHYANFKRNSLEYPNFENVFLATGDENADMKEVVSSLEKDMKPTNFNDAMDKAAKMILMGGNIGKIASLITLGVQGDAVVGIAEQILKIDNGVVETADATMNVLEAVHNAAEYGGVLEGASHGLAAIPIVGAAVGLLGIRSTLKEASEKLAETATELGKEAGYWQGGHVIATLKMLKLMDPEGLVNEILTLPPNEKDFIMNKLKQSDLSLKDKSKEFIEKILQPMIIKFLDMIESSYPNLGQALKRADAENFEVYTEAGLKVGFGVAGVATSVASAAFTLGAIGTAPAWVPLVGFCAATGSLVVGLGYFIKKELKTGGNPNSLLDMQEDQSLLTMEIKNYSMVDE